jgi:hypothetical protein
MKLLQSLVALGTMVVLASCNNFNGTAVLPTITVSNGETSLTFDTTNNRWKGTIQARLYALPGSAGGTIRSFTALSGATLAVGAAIPKCDVSTQITPPVQNCGPYTVSWSWDSPAFPSRDDWTVVSYLAEGENSIPASVKLGAPQPLL